MYVSRRKPSKGPFASEGDRYTLLDLAVGAGPPSAWCPVCEIIPTHPARHCVHCGHCVHWPSHHSRRANVCVAAKNHRGFVWYHIVYMTAQVALLVYLLNSTDLGEDAWYDLENLLYDYAWQACVCASSVGYSLVCGAALWKELSAVVSGRTPHYPATPRVAFTFSQNLSNLMHFMLRGKILHKDPVVMS